MRLSKRLCHLFAHGSWAQAVSAASADGASIAHGIACVSHDSILLQLCEQASDALQRLQLEQLPLALRHCYRKAFLSDNGAPLVLQLLAMVFHLLHSSVLEDKSKQNIVYRQQRQKRGIDQIRAQSNQPPL
jgi:hypothetical protein